MILVTLPGTIPGLLRRGSPVRFRDEDTPWSVLQVKGTEVYAAPADPHPLGLWASAEEFHLDLSDETGRAHAAWWLAQRMVKGAGPIARALGVQRWKYIDLLVLLATTAAPMSSEQVDLLRRAVLHAAEGEADQKRLT